MAQDMELNNILKKMWAIDEKKQHSQLSKEEITFWNNNLHKIKAYYTRNEIYWSDKQPIK